MPKCRTCEEWKIEAARQKTIAQDLFKKNLGLQEENELLRAACDKLLTEIATGGDPYRLRA